MIELFAARPLADDERAAHDEDPRPGVWAGERGADLRKLTQGQTDGLIRAELVALASSAELDEVLRSVGGWEGYGSERVWVSWDPARHITRQRGGLDSDPLVRLLAHRAWGDRDRLWFEERGVQKGDQLTSRGGSFTVHRAWPGEYVIGISEHDARPGDTITIVSRQGVPEQFRVSARRRERRVDS